MKHVKILGEILEVVGECFREASGKIIKKSVGIKEMLKKFTKIVRKIGWNFYQKFGI